MERTVEDMKATDKTMKITQNIYTVNAITNSNSCQLQQSTPKNSISAEAGNVVEAGDALEAGDAVEDGDIVGPDVGDVVEAMRWRLAMRGGYLEVDFAGSQPAAFFIPAICLFTSGMRAESP